MGVNSVAPLPGKASVSTADEYEGAIASAQESLQRAAGRVGPHGDETRLWLVAQSDALGALLKTTRRWEQATADVIETRDTFGEAERARTIRDLIEAAQGSFTAEVRKRAERMVRGFDRRTTVLIGGCIGGAFVGGLLLGALGLAGVLWWKSVGPWGANAAWAELAHDNPDSGQSLANGVAGVASDGRHYTVVSLWTEPAKAPPPPKPANK